MEFRIIKSPSKGVVDILRRRSSLGNQQKEIKNMDAIGLVQGRLIEMVSATDIAEKATGVIAEDIRGNCPQSMVMLALFGDTASVEMAIEEIRRNEQEVRKK
jgi:BMC domain.